MVSVLMDEEAVLVAVADGRVAVVVDPSSRVFSNDRLFALAANDIDEHLTPLACLRDALMAQGMEVHTADWLGSAGKRTRAFLISLCRLRDFGSLTRRGDVTLVSFLAAEPPVVAPAVYRTLPTISAVFRKVYLYNTTGSGYEGHLPASNNLHRLFIPQGRKTVSEAHWENRQRRLVAMINANKGAGSRPGELYSERVKAVAEMGRLGDFDLFGHGWDLKSLSARELLVRAYLHYRGQALPRVYCAHRRMLLSCYRGTARSKMDTLSRYKFAICFENMVMPGYITEKIFDCFFAGTVPVYLGAPDITDYIPKEAFIDRRDFGSYTDLHEYLCSLPESRVVQFKEAAREFVNSDRFHPFTTERFVSQVLADLAEAMTGLGADGNQESVYV